MCSSHPAENAESIQVLQPYSSAAMNRHNVIMARKVLDFQITFELWQAFLMEASEVSVEASETANDMRH